jgi:hypothetical protein
MKPSLSCILPSFSLEKKKIEVLMENDPLLFLLIVPFNSLLITSTVVQVGSPPTLGLVANCKTKRDF